MKNLIIGISGASGAPLAVALLKTLQDIKDVKTHVVVSKGGEFTLRHESSEDVRTLCDVYYENSALDSAIASGTFRADGMIVLPCSMKSVAGIKNGFSDTLLLRAADVCIKEKRKLILVPRESPLSPIHLDNLAYLSKLQNVVILPPVLSYYHLPKTVHDMEIHLIGKILDFFDIEIENFKRWK